MPQIKSAKKRVLITAKKNLANKSLASEMKTQIKKFETTLATDIESAKAMLPQTVSIISIAAKKNIISAKAASRKQSQLYIAINKAEKAQSEVVAEEVKEEVKEEAPVEAEVKPAPKKRTSTKAKTEKAE